MPTCRIRFANAEADDDDGKCGSKKQVSQIQNVLRKRRKNRKKVLVVVDAFIEKGQLLADERMKGIVNKDGGCEMCVQVEYEV